MFRHLGRFAVLALCLFAIVIAMGSCGGDDTDEEEVEVEIEKPPTAEELFERQLRGDWEVREFNGKTLETNAQDIGTRFAHRELIQPTFGTWSQVRIRGGSVDWKWNIQIERSDLPEIDDRKRESFSCTFQIFGFYSIKEESGSSGSSAIIGTLSFHQVDRFCNGIPHRDQKIPREWIEELILGDVVVDERASINGNQFRIGDFLFEKRE